MNAAKDIKELGDAADLQAGVGFPKGLQGKDDGDFPFAKVGDISRASRSGLTYLDTAIMSMTPT